MHLKWHLPRCVFNGVSREFSCVIYMLQNILASNLDYVVDPANNCVISNLRDL